MYRILLSPYSKIFYSEWKLDQNRNDYNIVFDQNLEGKINIAKLNDAIKRLISDYVILNSHVEDKDGELYWVKNKKICELEYFDNRITNKNILSYILEPFNLELGPLYKFRLIKNSNNQYQLIIVLHHILIDGLSFGSFCNKLSNYYNDKNYKVNVSIKEQISSLSKVSNELTQYVKLTKEKSKAFWRKRLVDFEPLNLDFLKLQVQHNDKQVNSSSLSQSNIGEVKFNFGKKVLQKLDLLRKNYTITPYLYSKIIFAVLLHKYTSQNKFCISYPIAIKEGLEFIHGACVNTNLLPFDFSKTNNLIDLINQAKNFIKSLKQRGINHSYLLISDIVSLLNKDILNVSFIQTNLKNQIFEFNNTKATINDKGNIDLLNNISFEQEVKTKTINYRVRYKLDKIDTLLLNKFIECYKRLFLEILDELVRIRKTIRLKHTKSYDLLSQEQYQQIIHRWNDTDKGYSNDKTIHELFEEQVERSPDSIAVIYEKIQLTYRELNERSNKLAAYIRQTQDIKPDTLIALCLDRGEHMLIGILAVLKAGGAYVPIDPNYPDERIKYILEDTGSKMILTNEIHTQRLEGLSQVSLSHGDNGELSHLEVIAIDSAALQSQLCLELAVNLNTETTSANLAYVIYTSGTTGNPKGVMIEHKGIVNRINWMNYMYPLNSMDKILQKTPYVFDVSVWELFWASWYGACLIFTKPERHKDTNYIIDLIDRELITITHFVPSMLSIFEDTIRKSLEQLNFNTKLIYNLKYIFCSGEPLSLTQVKKCHKILPNTEIQNLYGPTEASIDVLYYNCSDKYIKAICIGRQIHNVKAYVLNSNLTPLPIGAVGELHIGGIGLARGYLNRPELTAEKFIANPFQSEEERKRGKNSRIYRTGDLVRWLSDGSLEYIGRNDSQVKIRGYRIELGEIENVLSSYDGIKQCVVLTKERSNNEDDSNSNRYLVGYYISDNKLDELAILNYLQSKLPEYMIPTVLVHLRKLPLTINGKLDRKGLPDPKLISSNSYIAPRNELEKQVCRIWAEVFNLSEDKVSIHDDFFKLGGDSIVSIQVVSKLRQRLGLNSSVKDIFSYRSIARLCDNVLNKVLVIGNNNVIQAEQGVLSGEVELLPIQEWFFENNFAVFNHWNQSFLLRTPNLDLTRLQISVGQLIKHHDAFRLRYKKAKDKDLAKDQNINYIQYYNPKIKAEELKILDIRTLKAEEDSIEFIVKLQEIFTNWQNEFNIEKGPIYNIGYIHGYADGSSRIWFALHHLIVDTVSWRILAEDLKDLYHNKTLGIKGSSYRQWVNAVRGYVNNHEEERVYWNDVLVDYDINNSLNRLVVSKDTSNCTSLKLSIKQTNQLLQRCNRAYNTEINDILLTALGYTLTELTGSRVNHIILEGHGREEIDSNIDVSRTLGWFTSMYPVRLEISDELDNSIKRVKENLRRIPNKGIGYGLLIGYKKEKLPRISFNYLGQLDKKNQTFWNIIAEGSGIAIDPENEDYNIININGMVINGELQFSIASKLDQINTTEIARTFKQKLESIINYTVSQTRSYLTVSDIGNIINQDYLDKLQENREIEGVYLANSLQQGFIYHALNQGEVDDAYRVQLIWQYNNYLDIEKLQEAWKYAQKRYTPLRLRLAWEDELVQIIDKKGVLDWRYMDLSTELEEKIQALKIKQIQKQDRFEPYKLGHGNLFRIYIIRQKEDLYTCIFSNHHTILDGWSNPILLDYVHETYLKLLDNRKVEEIVDQSYECTQKYLQEHQNDNKYYWDQYVSYAGERSNLSCLLSPDSKYVKISEYKHIKCLKDQTLKISKSLYKRLKKISEEGVTLNAILQYVWHKILNIYGSSNQTIVGTTVSGRNLPIDNIEKAVGLYINTVPLIFEHSEQTSKNIIESIKTIQDNINEANSRSNVNLTKLQKGGERLFDSLFIYENYPTSEDKQDRLNISTKKVIEKLDYPLGVIAYESIDELIFNIKYAGELFSEKNIENILLTARTLLEQISLDPSQKAQALNYLNQEQYQQIIHRWNDTDKGYSNDKTIHELFEEQVERSPDSIAVIYEKIQLTYRELNERSNKLAAYIRQTQDIKPDTLIALCLDRGEHMLIGILAVLKAGGAYVPIDPNYPDERIKYILEDTGSKMILTNEIHTQRLEGLSQVSLSHGDNGELSHLEVIAIDSAALQSQLCLELAINLNTETTSANLAYVIYTSGTTGNPKGVMIEHKNLVNCSVAAIKRRKINDNSQVLHIAPYVFDSSILEIYPSLLSGGSLFIVNETYRKDTYFIQNYCIKQSITNLFLTTKLAEEFLLLDKSKLKLINLTIGGEKLIKVSKSKFDIINEYGPTENTVCTTEYKIKKPYTITVPIGIPVSNSKCYVLNSNLTPLPIGAVGELHIGGIGLARGYLNRPELTAEKFIANPFQSEEERKRGKNSRIYRTGDLVRWLSDGSLEYIGRNDSQVKIRGYRIELGEIENVLSSYDGIKQCVVLTKERSNNEDDSNSNRYLVGYYISDNKLDELAILNYLQSKLPEYMIPTMLVHLRKLPLTINGKLDRKGLPDPKLISSNSYIAPRNELEKQVCRIWAEVLDLPKKKVGIRDDFFKLGGNSIQAVKLIHKINKRINTNINISSILKHNTIEKFCYYLAYGQKDNITIKKILVARAEEYLLSFAQERLWFIEQYQGGTNAYNVPLVFQLCDGVNLEILKRSIKAIISRHEILHTIIRENEKGQGYQHILNIKQASLKVKKLQVPTFNELRKEINKEINYLFNLREEYPIRICTYRLRKKYYISIVLHHIAFDGWSIEIFLRELNLFYKYYTNQEQEELNLPLLNIQYKDFAIWQRSYLSEIIFEKQFNYWKSKLDRYETLNLISDKPRPQQIDYTGSVIHFEISNSISNSLRALAKELQVSLYSLLLAAYYLMLRSYSKQNDIVIGISVANRNYSGIENLIGFFVNSLALRISIDVDNTVKEFIKIIGKEVIEAQLNQDLPFEKLVEKLAVEKDTSRHPIFQVKFLMQEFSESNFQSDLLQPYNINTYEVARFDITLLIDDKSKNIRGSFNYALSLYKKETIQGFIDTYSTILYQFTKTTDNKISDLYYLNYKEYKQIVYNWNNTDKGYSNDKTIHELFEEQVERSPDSIAVIYEKIQLTYRELNERSNKLAAYIRQTQDIKPDTLIALCLDRGEHMLIGILAVLKAGGAYVPIDPNYPDERIKYILEDTGSKMILTNEIHTQRLEGLSQVSLSHGDNGELSHLEVIAIDSAALQSQLCLELAVNLNTETTSANLAYVIYTSGTTGKPKGVLIEHKGIVNYVHNILSKFSFNNNSKCLITSEYNFDLSYTLLFGTISSGGEIHLLPRKQLFDLVFITNYINNKNISIIKFTPSYFKLIIDHCKTESVYLSNKPLIVILGGEKIPRTILHDLANRYNKNLLILYNHYGPTETTIGCITTSIDYTNNYLVNSFYITSFIGKPFNNTKCYVLDNNLNPLPIGAVGELYIGGIGLARGYLNRSELTVEKFIANPFQSEKERKEGKNSRIYRTGDLVRWLSDGSLEYIGRNDFQVKLRGYRIELGEIENILLEHGDVSHAIVAVKNIQSRQKLVAYFIPKEFTPLPNELQDYLCKRLPEYMVPEQYVLLEKLPLINGKLDRNSLPDFEIRDSKNYMVPRNKLEKQIWTIWAEVLGLSKEEIGIKDDFFKLGGDSITSIQLVNRLRHILSLNISIKDIFIYRTIKKLYDNVLNKVLVIGNNNVIQAEQGVLSGEVELLPIQEWFFENNFAVFNHWNQSFLLRTPNLDLTRLQISVGQLIKHHDAFRLRYKKAKDKDLAKDQNINYIQYYNPKIKAEELKILDIRTLKAEEDSIEFIVKLQEIFTNWQNEFNIEKGPIYNIGYIHGYADGSSRIWFALHHLIVDTVSWRILAEDLKDLYHNKTLGVKGSSYRQWVNAVRGYVNNHEEERVYWKNILKNYNEEQTLHSSANKLYFSEFVLSTQETDQLLKEVNKAYNTEINDILLTALSYALFQITNNRVNYITLEGHGREDIDNTINITKTLGWFTTMYPVSLSIGKDLGESIKIIKETLRLVPNKGIGYGPLMGYNNLPQIRFNYLGQFNNKNKSLWNIVNEASGLSVDPTNHNANIIDITGLVADTRIKFNVASRLSKVDTKRFNNILKHQLKNVIIHCIKKTYPEYTISDFKDFEPYVSFNEDVLDNNIFIFPPANGGAESYFNNIVKEINNKKLILFNNYYDFIFNKLSPYCKQKITYESLAKEHITYIQSIQPKGPYNLFGWSFGGLLAFEICNQLVETGEEVQNLVMLDSYFEYKQVFSKLNINLIQPEENINYKYSPKVNGAISYVNIVLFKAINTFATPNNIEKDGIDINHYYVKNTKANYLDKILQNKKFKLIKTNCDHNTFLKCNNTIKKISFLLKNM